MQCEYCFTNSSVNLVQASNPIYHSPVLPLMQQYLNDNNIWVHGYIDLASSMLNNICGCHTEM